MPTLSLPHHQPREAVPIPPSSTNRPPLPSSLTQTVEWPQTVPRATRTLLPLRLQLSSGDVGGTLIFFNELRRTAVSSLFDTTWKERKTAAETARKNALSLLAECDSLFEVAEQGIGRNPGDARGDGYSSSLNDLNRKPGYFSLLEMTQRARALVTSKHRELLVMCDLCVACARKDDPNALAHSLVALQLALEDSLRNDEKRVTATYSYQTAKQSQHGGTVQGTTNDRTTMSQTNYAIVDDNRKDNIPFGLVGGINDSNNTDSATQQRLQAELTSIYLHRRRVQPLLRGIRRIAMTGISCYEPTNALAVVSAGMVCTVVFLVLFIETTSMPRIVYNGHPHMPRIYHHCYICLAFQPPLYLFMILFMILLLLVFLYFYFVGHPS